MQMKKYHDYSPGNGWPNKKDGHSFEIWYQMQVKKMWCRGGLKESNPAVFLRENLEISELAAP